MIGFLIVAGFVLVFVVAGAVWAASRPPKGCDATVVSRFGPLACIHEPGHGGCHVSLDGTRWVLTGGQSFHAWKVPEPSVSVEITADASQAIAAIERTQAEIATYAACSRPDGDED